MHILGSCINLDVKYNVLGEVMARTKKLTLKEVGDIVECEGLGYAIQHYMGHEEISNPKLRELWRRCKEDMNAIEAMLPVVSYED